MTEILIHAQTKDQLHNLAKRQAHAILLTGASGMGKGAVASYLAATLLEVDLSNLTSYPHIRFIRPVERKAIGIEAVRELEHFMSLKIPGNRSVMRIAIIEDAQLLTLEAQNALLKTLEEPPSGTVLILTSAYEQALLPTIRSRVQIINVKRPAQAELAALLAAYNDNNERVVQQALAVSGGLPGLATTLLSGDTEHPLAEAVQLARELLQKTAHERLLKVDELAKRKDFCRDLCFVLMQMAQLSLTKTTAPVRWQAVLKAAYEADEQLAGNAQPKLVLTNLMLQL